MSLRRQSRCRITLSVALTAASAGLLVAGCQGSDAILPPISTAGASTAASGPPLQVPMPTAAADTAEDYTRLLLESSEINVAGDTYAAPAPTRDPDGVKGAEVLMINRDQSRALGITVVVLADAAAAQAGLTQAKASLSTVVPTAPPRAAPAAMNTPFDFVVDVGQKQAIAVRVGLSSVS